MTRILAQHLDIRSPSPEVSLPLPAFDNHQCQVWVKRDDLLHAVISGNKWRKLQPQLQFIIEQGHRGILSFGGGHSNHLHALAYCCHQLSLPFTAIVRGDYRAHLTPTLKDLTLWQADIRYVSKIEYRRRDETGYLAALNQQYPGYAIVPEGGSASLALAGIAAMCEELKQTYDTVLAPVASGATLAGLVRAFAGSNTRVLGIAVLKSEAYLTEQVTRFLDEGCQQADWHICHDYHFGGYAKAPEALTRFCQQWQQETGIPTEPVYSGKLFYALNDLLDNGYFAPGSRVLALHTGGLQGARGAR